MEITLQRQNQAFHFEAVNETGALLSLDGNAEIGGENKGFSPMQSLLAAMAVCSAIDIGLILQKQKQQIDDFRIRVKGDRTAVGEAKVFSQIHVIYELAGELDPAKVQRAIDLSLEKYCSVSKMLEKTAEITASFTLNAPAHE